MRDWLRTIRKSLNMTQDKVAKIANISRTYYLRIEIGDRGNKLPVQTAKAIAEALHFNWERFYEDEETLVS